MEEKWRRRRLLMDAVRGLLHGQAEEVDLDH